jgi:hypothetical protein
MTEFLRKLAKTEVRVIVTLIDSIACYAIVFMILTRRIPPENRDLAIQLVTMIIAGTLIVNRNFLFGSSKNESDKTKKEEV